MIKWLTSFILSIFFTASVQAQGVDFGLRAGLNFPGMEVREFEDNATYDELKSGDRQWGFHAGLYTKIDLTGLYLEPQVLFTNLNHELTATDDNGEEQDIALSINRVDFPLLLGTELGPARFYAGPVYSINIPESEKDLNLEDGSFGYQAGIGLQIQKVIVDVKYEGAFSKTASELIINNTPYQTDLRGDQLIVSLGFQLF